MGKGSTEEDITLKASSQPKEYDGGLLLISRTENTVLNMPLQMAGQFQDIKSHGFAKENLSMKVTAELKGGNDTSGIYDIPLATGSVELSNAKPLGFIIGTIVFRRSWKK